MGNKERFIRAIARWQNYHSHKETKSKLLEKAFGSDTMIFDFDGVDELLDSIIDMSCLMFPNISEEDIRTNIEWYLYETPGQEEPEVYDSESGKKYIIKSPKELYDMLYDFN
jgi:hypothetical protein